MYVALLLIVGLGMGTVFDIYNTVTGVTKWFRWMRPLIDILFWVVSACGVYYVVLTMDSGRLRVYTFVLLAMGYVGYRLTIQDVVVRSAYGIVRFVQAVLRICAQILGILIWRPARAVLRIADWCLQALYQLACRGEDVLLWVLHFVFVRIIGRWLAKFPGVQRSFEWCRKSWEELWNAASNLIQSVWVRS